MRIPTSYYRVTSATIYTLLLCFSGNIPLQGQYTISDTFGDLGVCDTMTRGPFIVWWDAAFDYGNEVDNILDSLIKYREICLQELDMQDPPSALDGHYINIYIHGNGHFLPNGWANGVGTDANGYPFYACPNGIIYNGWNTIAHEAFHLFQYNSDSPGFAYEGDSQWYTEASANWFAARLYPNSLDRFVEAESLVRLPHVPLWLSFDNFPSDYPDNWQRNVHQYALALYLYYLTEEAGVNESVITSGFYGEVQESPQEYLYHMVGRDDFRQHFRDWTARMTHDFDFLPADQVANNLAEWNDYAAPEDDNQFIEIYDNEGTDGWVAPDDEDLTHAWSFNTYLLLNDQAATYAFQLNAEPNGTYGTAAHFQAKILVKRTDGSASFTDLDMTNAYQGVASINATAEDSEIYFVIVSMPEVFEDSNPEFQQFPYEMRIDKSPITHTEDLPRERPRKAIARFNARGQAIHETDGGVQIIWYDDGSAERVFEYGE